MICEELDLDLLSDLCFHPCLFYIFLVDHLDRQDKSRPKITGHVHVSESSLSQFSTHLELSQRQCFSFSGDEHAAEVEERLVGAFSVVLSALVLGGVQFLVGVVPLGNFHVPVLVLFLLGDSGLGLVGVDHSRIAAADCLLLHVFDVDSRLFVILTDHCFYLPGSHLSVVVQPAL